MPTFLDGPVDQVIDPTVCGLSTFKTIARLDCRVTHLPTLSDGVCALANVEHLAIICHDGIHALISRKWRELQEDKWTIPVLVQLQIPVIVISRTWRAQDRCAKFIAANFYGTCQDEVISANRHRRMRTHILKREKGRREIEIRMFIFTS